MRGVMMFVEVGFDILGYEGLASFRNWIIFRLGGVHALAEPSFQFTEQKELLIEICPQIIKFIFNFLTYFECAQLLNSPPQLQFVRQHT